MIEAMKIVNLLTLREDRTATLKALREMEILHVQPGTQESADLVEALRAAEDLQTLMFAVREFADDRISDAGEYAELPPEALASLAKGILDTFTAARERAQNLRREIHELEPWGNFEPNRLKKLQEQGISAKLCVANQKQLPILPDDATLVEVKRQGDTVYFLVLSQSGLPEDLPEIRLPEKAIGDLQQELKECDAEAAAAAGKLARISHQADKLRSAFLLRQDEAELTRVRDSMDAASDRLLFLTGYVPEGREADLREAALKHGWALRLEKPAIDDRNVPTQLRIPGWLNLSRPLFDFIGIRPGYREYDVSGVFLLFFMVFFGIIMGDGGYGALILIAALIAKAKFRSEKAQPTINLFLALSIMTIIWGFLTGNWFAIPNGADGGKTLLPMALRGIPWFTSPEHGDQNVQLLCFLIAVLHLSIAHLWQALSLAQGKRYLRALGQVGWLLFVGGVFLVIIEMVVRIELSPAMQKAYLVMLATGFALMLLFSINWKDVGDVLNFPFGALGGFVDSLSYIRLFAVGLSGFYVADAVNRMAADLAQTGVGGIVFAVLITLFGHALNMTLCAMGVLVHGIRLNTLEFSGHLGLEWTGRPFAPFRKRVE